MSQLIPLRSNAADTNITAVVDQAPAIGATATPFGYVPELVTSLLDPLVKISSPSQVRALEKAITIAKGRLAKSLTLARNELIGVLREAPSGVFASAEATADEVLWNACSADLEHKLMEATRVAKGKSHPSKVVDELLAQVSHRIELAMIEARDMVEVARIRAALPPAPTRGYEPCWGEVTGVRDFGAFIALPSGESGLLHASEMRSLNGGRHVADATRLLNVGQALHVRVASKNAKGQLNLALESEVSA